MAVNKVILIGNVGQDPTIRTVGDAQVAQFSLACTERGYTRQDGTQVPERTEWINIVCWRRLATLVEKYAPKGTKLYIEGKLATRKYTGKDNIERSVTEVIAENIELLGSKPQTQQPQAAAPFVGEPQGHPSPATTSGGDGLPF